MKSIALYNLFKLALAAAMLSLLAACTGGISSSNDMSNYAHVDRAAVAVAETPGIDWY